MSAEARLSCASARSLLVAHRSGPDRTGDSETLRQHLAACPDCRAYEGVVMRVESAVALETRRTPAPQEGLQALRAVVRANRPRRSLWPESIRSAGRNLIRIQMPAYQAALGAAAVAILVFASLPAPRQPVGPTWGRSSQVGGAATALTRADSYRVDQMLRRLDRQQRGPLADTLLSRYLSRQAAGGGHRRTTM